MNGFFYTHVWGWKRYVCLYFVRCAHILFYKQELRFEVNEEEKKSAVNDSFI